MSYIPMTPITGQTVLNFGVEGDYAANTVSNAKIKSANVANATFVPVETTATSIDDFKLNGVSIQIANVVDNTSFDIVGFSENGATGNYTVNYYITIFA